VSCYGCSPSTGTNASSSPAAPSQACASQQPGTQSCSEFHFRSATSSFARRPASQPAHRNTARCDLSSDAHAGATRRRRAHRHAGAVRRTSVSLAFCCRRTLRAQAASHSSADKSRRAPAPTVCTHEHQYMQKPLTTTSYGSPSLTPPAPPPPFSPSPKTRETPHSSPPAHKKYLAQPISSPPTPLHPAPLTRCHPPSPPPYPHIPPAPQSLTHPSSSRLLSLTLRTLHHPPPQHPQNTSSLPTTPPHPPMCASLPSPQCTASSAVANSVCMWVHSVGDAGKVLSNALR